LGVSSRARSVLSRAVAMLRLGIFLLLFERAFAHPWHSLRAVARRARGNSED
jgi:hypothetical protein